MRKAREGLNGEAVGPWSSDNFFFQAEDGIRDRNVTGVQTCALPISGSQLDPEGRVGARHVVAAHAVRAVRGDPVPRGLDEVSADPPAAGVELGEDDVVVEIGRASCRERVWGRGAARSGGGEVPARYW